MHNPTTATCDHAEREPYVLALRRPEDAEPHFAPLSAGPPQLAITTIADELDGRSSACSCPTASCSSGQRPMLTIERIAHPRQRRRATTTAAAAAAAAAPEEAASHILRPLTENLGEAWWSAHAHRCVEQLPQELAWAAPLLDPERPRAVRCAREQARRLIVWHHQLPTYEQVSFSCERPAQGARPGGRR